MYLELPKKLSKKQQLLLIVQFDILTDLCNYSDKEV
jgi:hypothetical protein